MTEKTCCEQCLYWEKHGKDCWYYWELKKNCTMHSDKSEMPSLQ